MSLHLNCCLTFVCCSGDSSCRECPTGFACPISETDPIQCLAGSFSLGGIVTECTTCPAGYECPYGNYSSICVAGLSAVPGSEHCAACLAGTYSDVAGSAECQSCPAGYGCTSSTVAPVACVIGQYALAGAGECTTCPVGMSCPTVDTAPVACLSGSISMAGITNCTLCPAGSYCGPGYEIPCPLGTYSSGRQLCAISLLSLC